MRRRRLSFIASDTTICRMGKARRVFTEEERKAGKQPCITNAFRPDGMHTQNQRKKKYDLTQTIARERDRGDPDGDLPHATTPAKKKEKYFKEGPEVKIP